MQLPNPPPRALALEPVRPAHRRQITRALRTIVRSCLHCGTTSAFVGIGAATTPHDREVVPPLWHVRSLPKAVERATAPHDRGVVPPFRRESLRCDGEHVRRESSLARRRAAPPCAPSPSHDREGRAICLPAEFQRLDRLSLADIRSAVVVKVQCRLTVAEERRDGAVGLAGVEHGGGRKVAQV